MINAKHVRLGNFIYGTDGTVKEVTLEAISYLDRYTGINQADGIFITNTWLEKLGFVKIAGNYEINNGTTNLVYHKDEINEVIEGQWKGYSHIKFIHQLQNLWFALTGEELELSPIETA